MLFSTDCESPLDFIGVGNISHLGQHSAYSFLYSIIKKVESSHRDISRRKYNGRSNTTKINVTLC